MAPSEIGIWASHSPFVDHDPTEAYERLIHGTQHASTPRGWPTCLESPMVWTGPQFNSNTSYTYVLNDSEKQEIHDALKHFESLELLGQEAGVENFPLPTLGEKLRQAAVDIHGGRGFFVLRGLELEQYTLEDSVVIFLGVSAYIGSKRGRQDDDGRMLSHVRLARLMKCGLDQRPIKDSNLGCAFHNDIFCDILAMMTRTIAAKGGNHIISSAWTIYNELGATRPDLLSTLAKPIWPFDIRGRLCQTETRPVIYNQDGHILMSMLPEALLGVPDIPRAQNLPILSDIQVEALVAVQMLASKHRLVLKTEPGDLTFINNFSLVHSREAFYDDDKEVRKCRYMVRLWLKNEELAWELPRQLELGNRLVYDDEEVEEFWNVAPEPRLFYSLRERFSP